MTYTLIPAASGSTLLNTRDLIRTNFQIIQNRFEDDHTAYSTGTGKHDKMTMPVQNPVPTSGASEGLLYCKDVSGSSELMFERDAGTPFQLTGGNAATNGYCYLCEGIIMQWGVVSSPGKTGTVTFATSNIEFPNNCFNVSLTLRRDGSDSNQSVFLDEAPTKSLFKFTGTTSSNDALYWTAIGN